MANQGSSGSTPQIPLPRSKRGVRAFWVETVRELKKVTWPPVHETNRLTGVVMVICGLLIAIMTTMHLIAHNAVTILLKGF
jgi:preprotein translocase SecE subunit